MFNSGDNKTRSITPNCLIISHSRFVNRFCLINFGLLQMRQNVPITFSLAILNTLFQQHIFKHLHPSFKRALACHMSARICIPGEVIYTMEKSQDCMTYLARGSVHLLSIVDGESPLITLSAGTTIGKVNLIYCINNPTKVRFNQFFREIFSVIFFFQVVAATYCTIYVLEKRALWNKISNYKQLHQAKILHNNMRVSKIVRKILRNRCPNFLMYVFQLILLKNVAFMEIEILHNLPSKLRLIIQT